VISQSARERTAAALHALGHNGRYADLPGAQPELGATLSVLKALALLGDRPRDPDAIHADVTGQAVDGRWGAPAVLPTAAALLTLHGVDARDTLHRSLEPALHWMDERAASREEHFMTIAVADECAAAVPVPRSVAFFRGLETPDGTFGTSPLQNGIAASALLRAGEPLRDPAAVTRLLLAAQRPDGGFADDGAAGDLWTTYCVMRALDLLSASPDGPRLARWVLDRQLDGAGAGGTYQCLSILDWIATPVLDAARRGDCVTVRRHLQTGGDPDIHDLTGWTPLAAAAVRGQAPVVRLLLEADRPANPDLRVPDADALPVFWAGQSGDLDTVRALLKHRPQHLHAISSVNGHTVLLQAVFFGTQRHCELVDWLLDNLGAVLDVPADAVPAERRRLLAACNVRGYTARTMAELWHNETMAKLLSVVDDTTEQERDAYRAGLLASIAGPPDPAADALFATIDQGMAAVNAGSDEAALLSAVTAAVEAPGFDINRQAGPLGQTPVIAAVTGTDADARVSAARLRLLDLLLRHGADPDLPERHPMAVDAVIRAAVLNHFDCLQRIAQAMGPHAFAAALNERPAINGQTALDDTVHRALTAPDDALQSHLDQIRWAIEHGARSDVPDLTGVTVADRARLAQNDDVLKRNAPSVLAALGLPAHNG